jgi:hypothetical protein
VDELYHLPTDPHEMTNLAHNPEYSGDLAAMRGELHRLLREKGYPVDAHPGAPPDVTGLRRNRPDRVVLEYTWETVDTDRTVDSSGMGHHGVIQGAVAGEDDGTAAYRFDGRGRIDVSPSAALDPSLGPWTVEVWVKPSAPDGVILSHGGESHGYALTIRDGKPGFHVRADGMVREVIAGETIGKDWVHLAGVLGAGGRVLIFVNGKPGGSVPEGIYIGTNPNEGLTIGLDAGTKVGTYGDLPGFNGQVGPVRIYAGERTARQIERDAVTR